MLDPAPSPEGPASPNVPPRTESIEYPDSPPPVPPRGIVIEFRHSSSPNFDLAVQEARKLPSFQQYGQGRKAVYRVVIGEAQIGDVIDLVDFIQNWKVASLYVNGERVPFKSVFGFLSCYRRKQTSYNPDLYCFGFENETSINIWGCIQAHMPFTSYARWFTYGRWLNKKGDWQFDKKRIAFELEKALYPYRYCPALDPELVRDAVAALPDKVNPLKDKNWMFYRAWDPSAPGLKVVERDGYFETTYTAIGVAPARPGALREVARKLKKYRAIRKLPARMK